MTADVFHFGFDAENNTVLASPNTVNAKMYNMPMQIDIVNAKYQNGVVD